MVAPPFGPPATIVVSTHEDFTASTANGAVGLIAIIIVLVGALQKAVLGGDKGVRDLSGEPIQGKRLVNPPPHPQWFLFLILQMVTERAGLPQTTQ